MMPVNCELTMLDQARMRLVFPAGAVAVIDNSTKIYAGRIDGS
jgi:hypothetical protein